MSKKINAKDLSYTKNLPPFLAALQREIGGRSGPDPMLAAQRRPTKKRSASEEAEDAPLVLDEHGDVLSGVTVGSDGAATLAPGAVTGRDDDSAADNGGIITHDEEGKQDDSVSASVGATKKRKAGKLVGGVAEEGDEGDDTPREKDIGRSGGAKDAKKLPTKTKVDQNGSKEKRRKAGKKIKLSFEDEEGGGV